MSAAVGGAYPIVPVFHPRRDARRALKRGYPRGAGSVRLCRTIQGVERLLEQRLVELRDKGRILEELDLDGLLARRPGLALVDELAHSNVPGSRHERLLSLTFGK